MGLDDVDDAHRQKRGLRFAPAERRKQQQQEELAASSAGGVAALAPHEEPMAVVLPQQPQHPHDELL
jgi:hypothetical protein